MKTTAATAWLCLLFAVNQVFSARDSSVDLPTPSGPFAVGTRTFDLTDEEREEVWTGRTGDPRRLTVQIWYPAPAEGSGPIAPYIARQDALEPTLRKYWSDMPNVRTRVRMDAPLLAGVQRLPLLVFSHGMNSARFFYTALLQDLASHGYVVAAVDHSYWSIGEAFGDGMVIGFDETMVARDKLSSDEIDRMMREGITTMALDQAFVARRILGAKPPDPLVAVGARVDPERVGILGHSMGGMAAQLSCLIWTCFRSCASLDGAVWNPVLSGMSPAKSGKPLLLLLSEQLFRPDPDFAAHYLGIWRSPEVLLVHGSRHNSFTDFPLLERVAPVAPGSLGIFDRIALAVRTFFDATLQPPKDQGPMGSLGTIDGLEAIDLEALARKAAAAGGP